MQFVNGGKPQRTGWLSRLATRVGLVATLVVSSLAPMTPTMVRAADEPDEAIVEGDATIGRHYRQAGGGSGNGYDVVNPFYSAMKELGSRLGRISGQQRIPGDGRMPVPGIPAVPLAAMQGRPGCPGEHVSGA